jgi:hypothetical protein
LQSFSLITGKQHTCPSDSNKIQQLLEFVGKTTSCLQNFKELQSLLDFSENYWKYRLRLASYQHVPGRMLTMQ